MITVNPNTRFTYCLVMIKPKCFLISLIIVLVNGELFSMNRRPQIIIDSEVNLNGEKWELPPEATIVFKGGKISNGELVGSNTSIKGKTCNVFDKVTISGSWIVPNVSTDMFVDLSNDNALRDVFALTNETQKNVVVIGEGDYYINLAEEREVGIRVVSNTTVELKGSIHLKPNSLSRYNILMVQGDNILITGTGKIVGDRKGHLADEGEWGMGININGGNSVNIDNINIYDCWGDCIYVGGNSHNVLIDQCNLDNSRRQGISVTKADGVTIKNCLITNISGTSPQYAIDVEPNRLDYVDNVLIDNVTVRDCEGGFFVTRGESKKGSDTPWIGHVTIRNCRISCKSRVPIRVRRCSDIEITGCFISWTRGKTAMSFLDVNSVVVENNSLKHSGSLFESLQQKAMDLLDGGDGQVLKIDSVKQKRIHNNRLVE